RLTRRAAAPGHRAGSRHDGPVPGPGGRRAELRRRVGRGAAMGRAPGRPTRDDAGMTAIDIPLALHRGADDLPFVDLGDGSDLQLLQCDVEAGLWVVRTRFQPGYVVQTHKHTGEVFALTLSGSWKY